MKIFLFLLAGVLFSGSALANEGVWIAITAFDGRKAGEYYGLISEEKYQAITTEVSENGIVKLEHVFWINDEGKIERMSTTNRHGHLYGYTNTVFFREDAITRMVLLDKKYLDTLDEK